MADRSLRVILLGEDRGLSRAMNTAGEGAGKLRQHLVGIGSLAAGAFAAGGLEKAADKYQELGRETLKLQRYTGGTAEAVSRLRFAAQESGVSAEALGKGMGRLSKFVETGKDQFNKYYDAMAAADANHKKFTKTLGVNASALASMGIRIETSSGHMRSMQDILLQLANHFQRMPAGVGKTSEVLKLFGKSGMDMLPFLNRGAAGIQDLMRESDKLGNTLSGKDLTAIKQNIQAHRTFTAAMDGLQIQIGRVVLPVMTRLTVFMTEKVIPAFQKTGQFIQRNKGWLVPLVTVLATAAAAFKVITVATAAWDAVLAVNPIVLITVAIAALAAGLIYAYKHSATFRAIVHEAFHVVSVAARDMWGVMRPIFKFIADYWMFVVGTIVHGAAMAFGWVPGVGPKLRAAAREFDVMRDHVNHALSGIHDKTVHVGVAVTGTAALDQLLNKVNTAPNVTFTAKPGQSFLQGLANSFANASHRALGGPVTAGHLYMVNERGQEGFIPSVNGTVVPHNRLGGGGETHIHIHVDGFAGTDTRRVANALADDMLAALRSKKRITNLQLA